MNVVITSEQRERLLSNLTHKGLNKRTQNYILKYANKNSEIFSNCIDMDKLIDRLSTNIDKNISYNLLNPTLNGVYNNGKKNIRVKPTLLFSKKRRESIILHELDHAATTTYGGISREYAVKFVDEKLKSFNIIQKIAMTKFKNITEFKRKSIDHIIKNENVRVGVHQLSKNRALNEGITRYKQLKYMGEELKGGYNTFVKDSYGPECKVASEIAKIIGEDNLVRMSFNNDFDGMCKLFSERTDGKGNLQEISTKLEETHSIKRYLHPIKFIKNYSSISKEFKECEKIVQEKKYKDISKNISNNKRSFGEQFKGMVRTDVDIEEYRKARIKREKELDTESKKVSYERTR